MAAPYFCKDANLVVQKDVVISCDFFTHMFMWNTNKDFPQYHDFSSGVRSKKNTITGLENYYILQDYPLKPHLLYSCKAGYS